MGKSRGRSRGRTRRGVGVVCVGVALVAGTVAGAPAGAATTPGQPDPGFGSGGVASIGLPVAEPAGRPLVLVDSWGRVLHVTGGGFSGSFPGDPAALTVVRLLPDGQQDPIFGATGVTVVPAPPATVDGTYDAVVTPDDAVVVLRSGRFPDQSGAVLTRLRPDGSPDPSFGAGGSVVLPGPLAAGAVAQRADGTVVVAGTRTIGGADRAVLVRVTRSGALDGTFGAGGEAIAPADGTWRGLSDVAATGSGELLVAGRGADGFQVGPVGADGTFGTPLPGAAEVRAALHATDAARLAVDVDGSATVAAEVQVVRPGFVPPFTVEESRLVRFRPDGTRNPAFFALCCGFRVTGLAVEQGGGVVVSGERLSDPVPGSGPIPASAWARVGPGGAPDPRFTGTEFVLSMAGGLGDVALTAAPAVLFGGWAAGAGLAGAFETYVARIGGAARPVTVAVTGFQARFAGGNLALAWADPPVAGPAVTGFVVADTAGHRLVLDGTARAASFPAPPPGRTVTVTVRAITVEGVGPPAVAVADVLPGPGSSTPTTAPTTSAPPPAAPVAAAPALAG